MKKWALSSSLDVVDFLGPEAPVNAGGQFERVLSEPHFIDVTYRKFFNQGELPAPFVQIATSAIAASNGHGVTSVRADGADDVYLGYVNILAQQSLCSHNKNTIHHCDVLLFWH